MIETAGGCRFYGNICYALTDIYKNKESKVAQRTGIRMVRVRIMQQLCILIHLEMQGIIDVSQT